MAMRRPRIKPVANIVSNSKRKPKLTSVSKSSKVCENLISTPEFEKPLNYIPNEEYQPKSNDNGAGILVDTNSNTNDVANADDNNIGSDETDDVKKKKENDKDLSYKHEISKPCCDDVNDSDAFKCPSKIGLPRAVSHNSNSGIDDVFYSDIEENAMHMDLEKSISNSCSISPSKSMGRQRIRPTPHFGQRRNSFVGSAPGNEDNNLNITGASNEIAQSPQTRRERHHSASSSTLSQCSSHPYHHTPHKYLPTGITNCGAGRVRTESGCSVFSDTNTSSHKSRKTEEHKQNPRKDFETRFLNGVPEKSAIKMSDLIYYNPITNPMEQKPALNVTLEKAISPLNDVKPLTEKQENDTSATTDNEAVPVPQLKLNDKGELILDDKSLVIETTAEQEARKVLANSSLIYLDEYTGMNGFYSRRKRVREWVPSDTIKFYRCLQNIGTDFSLMVSLFPNRTRRDLKLKFKKEERKNCQLINKALLYPKQFDIELLKQQIDEEEKRRDVQAKKAKIDEKLSKSKKKKISNLKSKASRVLVNGDVYQNEIKQTDEIVQNKINDCEEPDKSEKGNFLELKQKLKKRKTKRTKKPRNPKKVSKSLNKGPIIQNDDNANNVKKPRRRRAPNKKKKEEINIKEEIVKTEYRIESNHTCSHFEYEDNKQLETEIDELLDTDAIDIIYDKTLCATNVPLNTSQKSQCKEQIDTPPSPVLTSTQCEENYIDTDNNNDKYEHRTVVDLDNGSLDVYSNIKDDIDFIESPKIVSSSHELVTSESVIDDNNSIKSTRELDVNSDTERELSEDDIQSILTELAEGSLVLVSTLDPDDPDKVLNEIYMVDKNTGDLCEEPLSIPDNIVQCILTVASTG